MSDRHDWPREATEEEIQALRPSTARLASLVASVLAEHLGPPEDLLPTVELTATIVRDALASDSRLQELDEHRLSWDEALEIAAEVNEALRVALQALEGEG